MDPAPRSWLGRLAPRERFEARVVAFALALSLVAIPFSTLLLAVIRNSPVTRFDETVANDLHAHVVGHPVAIDALQFVSWLGKPLLLGVCVAIGAAYAFWRGRRRLSLFLVVAAIGGGLVDSAVKAAVNRPRPVFEVPVAAAFGKSFPSGHAMSSTVTYGALLLVFLPAVPRAKRWVATTATVTLVLAIGASRLLLGVHFVSDVAGGYALGLAWLLGTAALFDLWRQERGAGAVDLTDGLEPEAADDLTPGV